eukprot:m.228962 g.228962  ORF g.228962 m.228962 type:complete len:227 (-) comp17632_c0_seq1:264-944(-)
MGFCANLKVSRNLLLVLNTIFVMLSVVIITVASLAKAGSYVSSLNIIAGIITTGSFFLFVSLLGLWGAIRESQVTLFAYIILLGIVFILQFSISIAALAVDHHTTAADGWCALDDYDRISVQNKIGCYGFQSNLADNFNATLPDYCMRPGLRCPHSCNVLPDCPGGAEIKPTCPLCYDALKDQIELMLNRAGGVGLGLAFTMLVGIFAAYRFRKLKRDKPKYHEFL